MRRPSVGELPPELLRAVRGVARRIANAGHRAWIVGGAVRDLALGRVPEEVDLASGLEPDAVEGLFEQTVPVGRAFGTVLILGADGLRFEHTTFRREGGYRDGRHPTEVIFGASVEEDALRRDFTCNALFIDPLTDELVDPSGGMADIEARRLRCVGDPAERFAEDGLRLVRMARFAARLEFEIAPDVLSAARTCAAGLERVSGERIHGELERILETSNAARALALLHEAELLGRCLPFAEGDARALPERLEVVRALGDPPGFACGLAALFEPSSEAEEEEALGVIERLRPSRALRRRLQGLWRSSDEVEVLARTDGRGLRSRRIMLVRAEAFEDTIRLVAARRHARGEPQTVVEELRSFRASLTHDELFPTPLITSGDLQERGWPTGPEFGATLTEAEERQLDGLFGSRAEALAWLEERAPG